MKTDFSSIPGSVVAPRGFLASGVFCDIKRLGTGKGSNKGRKPDLALVVSEVPASVAGMFTTNQVCAAPVQVCRDHLKRGVASVIVVNSGNANACTGTQGLRDAMDMARATARELLVPVEQVLVGSTGRIGVALPMGNVQEGIRSASAALGYSPAHARAAAWAIMTSDTRRKEAAVEFKIGMRTVRLGGIAKGAGMIHPGMSPSGRRPVSLPGQRHATMLAYLTTDLDIRPVALQLALEEAVARSFNGITVDGDMSTNDTALILANGLAKNRAITVQDARRRTAAFRQFQAALDYVCFDLAKKMVCDGEGRNRVVTVRLQGARSMGEADAAARAVANSALVKTSWHGGDPNWGRIIAALGYSSAKVVEEKVDIGYSKPGCKAVVWSLRGGRPTQAKFRQLCRAVAPKEFDLHIRLNLGRSGAVILATDLTEAYVDFNKGDVTDPASLGG